MPDSSRFKIKSFFNQRMMIVFFMLSMLNTRFLFSVFRMCDTSP